jgi:hypothetical protein
MRKFVVKAAGLHDMEALGRLTGPAERFLEASTPRRST